MTGKDKLIGDNTLLDFLKRYSKLSSDYTYRINKNTLNLISIDIIDNKEHTCNILRIYSYDGTFEYETSLNNYNDSIYIDVTDFEELVKIYDLAKSLAGNLYVLYKIKKRND